MFVVEGTVRTDGYVAAQIHHIWVKTAADEFIKTFFDRQVRFIPESKRDAFAGQIRLYCEAKVLRILLIEKAGNDKYEMLLREFEKLIFPPTPNDEAWAHLQQLKTAMLRYEELNLVSAKKQMSWARAWFSQIGHDETNPETLALFIYLLALETQSLRDLIEKLGPPV